MTIINIYTKQVNYLTTGTMQLYSKLGRNEETESKRPYSYSNPSVSEQQSPHQALTCLMYLIGLRVSNQKYLQGNKIKQNRIFNS